MSDPLQTFLVAVIVLGYGTATSFLQERFGKFQDISPQMKQVVNSIINLVLPYALVFIQPYWKLEFGDPSQVLTSMLLLVMPALVWVVSQISHSIDRKLVK